MKQGVQIKLKREFAEGFVSLVDEYRALNYVQDIDKLIICGLLEIRHRLYIKLERDQKEYTLTLTNTQALSLRLFYTEFINDPTSYMGSKLMLLSNEIAKKYQS